jgi:hypothetical protein
MNTPDRGASLLLEHVHALAAEPERRRPPLVRLSEQIGPGLAVLLVEALASGQGSRRRGRLA